MDVTRNEFQDLVGAYALDACDPEEAAAIDSYIAADADAAREAERLRDAAAWLGAVGALNPPVGLRNRLLAAASERPDPLPPVDALRSESDRLEALLDSLEPADLDVTTYNGLSVRDLVTHIAIVDEAFVQEGSPPRPARARGRSSVRCGFRDDGGPAPRNCRLVVRADSRPLPPRAPGPGRPRRPAARNRPVRGLLARVGARDPGVRDLDAPPRHHVSARSSRGSGRGAGAAHDGRARDPDVADRAGREGLRVPRPHRAGRDERPGWR